MDLSFHKFPDLPTELRLQIWEAACCHIVATYTYGGLQYISARYQDGVVQASSGWSLSAGQSTSRRKNRSAYLYDSGLWKACKESKDIIANHTAFCKCLKIQERGVEKLWKGTQVIATIDVTSDMETVRRYHQQRGCRPFPELLRSPEGGKQCPMLAYSYNDIFCIQVDDWMPLRNIVGNFPAIHMPFGSWGENRREYPVRNWMQNIALEYEPSWVTDLPYPLFNLAYENSARGYLAYCLSSGLAFSVRYRRENSFWIIDKAAKWFASPPPPYTQQCIFWDCDAEYVEADWDHVAHRNRVSDDEADDAAGFIHRLDRFCRQARDLYPWDRRYVPYGPREPTPWIYHLDDPSSLKKIFRLLVRRDNQVKHVTTGCEAQCLTNGWCICSNEKEE